MKFTRVTHLRNAFHLPSNETLKPPPLPTAIKSSAAAVMLYYHSGEIS